MVNQQTGEGGKPTDGARFEREYSSSPANWRLATRTTLGMLRESSTWISETVDLSRQWAKPELDPENRTGK